MGRELFGLRIAGSESETSKRRSPAAVVRPMVRKAVPSGVAASKTPSATSARNAS